MDDREGTEDGFDDNTSSVMAEDFGLEHQITKKLDVINMG